MRYQGIGILVSFGLSFLLAPLIFAVLGTLFHLPPDIRVYAHAVASSRWIGFVQCLLIGWSLRWWTWAGVFRWSLFGRWLWVSLVASMFWITYLYQVVLSGWLAFYLTSPFAELAYLFPETWVEIPKITAYNCLLFTLFCLLWSISIYKWSRLEYSSEQ